MPEGLIHSYLEAFTGAWQPRDVYLRPGRDSKIGRRALRSSADSGGDHEEHGPETPDGGSGRGA